MSPNFRFRAWLRPALAALGLLILAVAAPAQAIETKAKYAILMERETGAILLEKAADAPMPPASMSKLMTILLVFEALGDGRLSLDDKLPVSEYAWRKGGAKSGSSTMFLEPGSRVRVEDLIRGIIVQSGNDACIVIAEGLAGSEEAFAEQMTRRGREIGLTGSVFKNATGWPEPGHVMTARDLAVLAKWTIEKFPEYYHYYGEMTFTYNGISQGNRNPLLYKDMGADGLKTGHTREAGYGLTASVKRGDRRLILVIAGLESARSRSREAVRLIEWAFREFQNYALFKAQEVVTDAEVWLGQEAVVPLVIESDLVVTLPRRARREMKVAAVFEGPIPAPVRKGDEIAKLVVTAPGVDAIEVPLVAGADVERLGLAGRLLASVKHLVWGSLK